MLTMCFVLRVSCSGCDMMYTLKFAESPPSILYSEDLQGELPAVEFVDVDRNIVRERSGSITAALQCKSLCDSELFASLPNCNLIPGISLSILNGVSARIPLYFTENSQGKIGMRYVWQLSSSQDNGPASRTISAVSSHFYNISFMGSASVYGVALSIVASDGGSLLTV